MATNFHSSPLQAKLSEAQTRQQEVQLRQEQAHGAARDKDHELSQLRSSKDQLQAKIDNLETALSLERGRAEGKQEAAEKARQHGTALEERLRCAR